MTTIQLIAILMLPLGLYLSYYVYKNELLTLQGCLKDQAKRGLKENNEWNVESIKRYIIRLEMKRKYENDKEREATDRMIRIMEDFLIEIKKSD